MYVCMFVHHWHIFMYVFIYMYVSSLGCTGPTLRTLGGFLIICSKCNVLSVGKILKQRVLSVRMEILEIFLSSKCMFVTILFFSLANIQHNSNINSAPSKKYSIYFRITMYIYIYVCVCDFTQKCICVCIPVCIYCLQKHENSQNSVATLKGFLR